MQEFMWNQVLSQCDINKEQMIKNGLKKLIPSTFGQEEDLVSTYKAVPYKQPSW